MTTDTTENTIDEIEEPEGTEVSFLSEEFRDFDIHLRLLIQENHPRVMNLEKPIPEEYPWEDLLRRHFAHIPVTLGREDYEYIIIGKTKFLKLLDSRKPTNFFNLLRYIEFFRTSLAQLQKNIDIIEQKHEQLKNTANEKVGLRSILKNNDWSYNAISNKHTIFKDALTQKFRLDKILRKLEFILAHNHNVSSRWQFLIEPLYQKTVAHINEELQNSQLFNMRMFFPDKSMGAKLHPHYNDSMRLIIELNEAVIQTNTFINANK